ncbi:hypothetical protein BJ912DRAFT_987204, partial [Pholiota molesta]
MYLCSVQRPHLTASFLFLVGEPSVLESALLWAICTTPQRMFSSSYFLLSRSSSFLGRHGIVIIVPVWFHHHCPNSSSPIAQHHPSTLIVNATSIPLDIIGHVRLCLHMHDTSTLGCALFTRALVVHTLISIASSHAYPIHQRSAPTN